VPPRPPGPPGRPPPPPPGRPAKPPPAPGAPPAPGRPAKPPPAPGRPGAPPRAGRSPGRPTAARSGIIPGLGRGPPGRGPPAPAGAGRPPCGRGIPWLGAKGLLPGRAAGSAAPPSRDSAWGSRASRASRLSRSLRGMPWLGANGLLPGRGAPGRGPGRLASPPSRATGAGAVPALAAAVFGAAISEMSETGPEAGWGPGVGAPRREGASGALTTAAGAAA